MMGTEACLFGMAGMGLISILLMIALVLAVSALAKYLFFSKKSTGSGTRGYERKEAQGPV